MPRERVCTVVASRLGVMQDSLPVARASVERTPQPRKGCLIEQTRGDTAFGTFAVRTDLKGRAK